MPKKLMLALALLTVVALAGCETPSSSPVSLDDMAATASSFAARM